MIEQELVVASGAVGARVQVAGTPELNEPPAPPSLQVTVPEGEEGELEVSFTVTVYWIPIPAGTEAWAGMILVIVGSVTE